MRGQRTVSMEPALLAREKEARTGDEDGKGQEGVSKEPVGLLCYVPPCSFARPPRPP